MVFIQLKWELYGPTWKHHCQNMQQSNIYSCPCTFKRSIRLTGIVKQNSKQINLQFASGFGRRYLVFKSWKHTKSNGRWSIRRPYCLSFWLIVRIVQSKSHGALTKAGFHSSLMSRLWNIKLKLMCTSAAVFGSMAHSKEAKTKSQIFVKDCLVRLESLLWQIKLIEENQAR